MENASKRVISFLLAMLMILEVLEPTIVSAQSLLNEDTGQVQREDKIFDDSPGDRGSSKNEFVIESKNPKENEQIEKSKAEPKREDTSKGTQRKENPKEEKQIHKEEKQNFKEENRKQNLKEEAPKEDISKNGYVSWRIKSKGKTKYKSGEKINYDGLLIEVTDQKGNKKELNYREVINDKNIRVKEESSGLFGAGSVPQKLILSTNGLRDLVINIDVQDNNDKKEEKSSQVLDKENSKDKLNKDAISEENKNSEDKDEEKEGLLDKIKEGLGLTNLQRADKELKEALADEENDIEKIQSLLTKLGEKYDLSREDQKKLMEDNEDAIKKLIDKDGEKNLRPNVLKGEEEGLENKKFTIRTVFKTSNISGPIQNYQYFKIHLDDKLTVNDPSSLKSIKYNGRVIARPTYDKGTNTIIYNIEGTIPDDIQVPINIDVDYNKENIKLDKDGTFTVVNKVSGLGVKAPKDLLPQKVDRNGNPAGSIIEPGRKDVGEIIERGKEGYKVNTDAYANPVIQDGELKGYNWTIRVISDKDLKGLGYKANFTTVKGSGLGDITSRSGSVNLLDNNIKDSLGINDSKHHSLASPMHEITYELYTPVINKQGSYMMDLSIILTEKGKVGAKRIIIDEGYPIEKVKEATPTRVGMNNRTTIMGEFSSNNSAKWTVTDGVSTGDKDAKLPLEDRELLGNQKFNTGQVAVYKIDKDTGRMVQDGAIEVVDSIPQKETNPQTIQDIGTIAVYEYDANINQEEDKNPLSLSGVEISKYEDLLIDQNWNLEEGLKMPEQTIKAIDPKTNDKLGEVNVPASTNDDSTRSILVPSAKVWDIDERGNATRFIPEIKQDLPNTNTIESDTVNYYENVNYYDRNIEGYYIHNRATKENIPNRGNFTIIKTDSKDPNKKLAGATFKLLGGSQVTTDEEGAALFSNVEPGTYTLYETKAPYGYKVNKENPTITVSNDGRVSVVGGNASISVGDNPTKTVAHGGYPEYMNAMQYAAIDEEGRVVTYIYLKADEARKGGSTNKDTRLSLRMNDGSISNVEVYDVDPTYQRSKLKSNMAQQTAEEVIPELGVSVLNAAHEAPIRGNGNVRDSFTNNLGYEVKLPAARFTRDWGFLVKVTGTGKSLTYDWLTDQNTGNEARLQNQNVVPSSPTDNKQTTITITNDAFETRPVEVTKMTKDKTPVQGATFVIKNSNKDVIATVSSDENGKASFGNLQEGKYTIEETEAPEGYIKSNVVFDVTVDGSNQVTYEPRFESGLGSPINGEDYWLEDTEESDSQVNANVTGVTQDLIINESQAGDIGIKPGVWEAYRLESLKYNASIDLSDSAPGKRFSIQFDPNLDFTQYFGEFPKINIGGREVADPYFNYATNKLTYVFNEKSKGGVATAKIELTGIIPNKFYAQNDGEFPFTITVAPGQTGLGNQTITRNIKADYEQYDYDPAGRKTSQSYYFRDVYKAEDGQWYVTALAYYNPVYANKGNNDVLNFNWKSTKYQSGNYVNWMGKGITPAFTLRDVKVYRTSPKIIELPIAGANDMYKKVNTNMPLSYGIRPEQDLNTYHLIYSKSIDPNRSITNDRQGSITLNYNPDKLDTFGEMRDKGPLNVQMPSVDRSHDYGYIIEQTFKIDDMDKFNNSWRAFNMSNGSFNSAFVTRANYNKASGDQTGGEIPKFYSQIVGLVNKKYTSGNFNIKKLDDANRSKTLAGASFSLTDSDKHVIYRSSGEDGIVNFNNLKPGTYTLKEEKSPDGYIKSDKVWRVNVGNDGYVTITEIGLDSTGESLAGKDITLEVTNKPKATKFVVYKKDDDNKPLKGAEFKLTKKGDKNAFAIGTSDGNGVVNFNKDLDKGTYILEETNPPLGYKKLNSKWVVEVDGSNKAKVYKYIEGPKNETDAKVNESLLGESGTKWVNVSKRPLYGWNLNDNRSTGYVDNYPEPYKMGTRIVAINKEKNYVIQRYVINPEGNSVTINRAIFHREKPHYDNMTWYYGNEDIKIFSLDKKVTGNVEDIRLENYKLEELDRKVGKSKVVVSGEGRLQLDFKNQTYTKPIIVDVKVPYKSVNGGVGTGMDLYYKDGSIAWKSDYYESVTYIVEGEPVVTGSEAGSIKGAYVSEDFLDVTNSREEHGFSFKKIDNDSHDAVTGATFKLQGPKVDDNNLGEERYQRSGTDGMVNFKDLVPGIYKLTETGPAQGYEPSKTDWRVVITKDGKVYIRDNNPSAEVPEVPKSTWQKVTDINEQNSSRTRAFGSYDNNPANSGKIVKTYITEVDKKNNKFKQVFVFNKHPVYMGNPVVEIHSYPENISLNEENTKILSVKEVNKASEPDKIVNPGADVSYNLKTTNKNGKDRLVLETTLAQSKTFAIEVESTIPNSGGFGIGSDLKNQGRTYWGAESYESLDGVKLAPLEESTSDRNATLYVGEDRSARTGNGVENSYALKSNPMMLAFSYNIKEEELDRGETPIPFKTDTELKIESVNKNMNSVYEGTVLAGDTDIITNIQRAGFSAYTDDKTITSKMANTEIASNASSENSNDELNIEDEEIPTPQRAGSGWEKIDTSRSEKPDSRANPNNPTRVHTKITEINKDTKQFKQIFLIDGRDNANNDFNLNIHRQPSGSLNKGDVSVRVFTVGNGSTVDNILSPGKDLALQGHVVEDGQNPGQLKIRFNGTGNRGFSKNNLFAIEVTSTYIDKTDLGLGMDYYYHRIGRPDQWQKYWGAQSYTSADAINRESYSVSASSQENGSVTANPNKDLKQGDSVTITVKPDQGFELDKLIVNGKDVTRNVNNNNYTFTMPNNNVTVSASFKEKKATTYSVWVQTVEGGSVIANPSTSVTEGEDVNLTINPNDGYELDKITYNDPEGNSHRLTSNKFTMPAYDVTLMPVFKRIPEANYKITINQSQNGSVTADKQSAKANETVNLTVSPDENFVLDSLTVTDDKGGNVNVDNNKFTMPESNVRVSATFKEKENLAPSDPIDEFIPEEGKDILINPDGESPKIVEITNKKAGITPKIFKRDGFGNPLEGATFTVKKMTDDTYKVEDNSFAPFTGTSDKEGVISFKNQSGQEIKLEKGYYLLKEDKAPMGYKKAAADWKIEVKDEGGRMYAVYQGPEDTASSLINDDEKANAGKSADNDAIKYKSRLTSIDPESKTFVQRIYVDTRGYKGNELLNVQIIPKIKREEIDTPGEHPKTIKEGVKTAYRTTYEITNPDGNSDINNAEFDKILRTYDLSKRNMAMINTARWRPFDWGFDEDQLNLDKGVYIIDVEGYYDDNITEEDIGKIELHVDFYEGARKFEQFTYKDGKEGWYDGYDASYQKGMQAVRDLIEEKYGKEEADKWFASKPDDQKYQNFLSKEAYYGSDKYIAGRVTPSVNEEPFYHADTSIDISTLYNSKSKEEIPKDGLTITNDEESYNITFSKHGRDDSDWKDNSKEVTNNRLEGAVFKLQVRGPGGIYEDMPGTTVASAFNGYFGFRGLKPGRYRLMEVKAPKGYIPIDEPILHMTIAYDKGGISEETGEITPGRGVITLEYNQNANGIIQYAPETRDENGNLITPEDGKLVDYVTSATAKNMGKIINEKPDKGKITITKKDDDMNLLNGAEFKLSKISATGGKENQGQVEVKTGVVGKSPNENGKLVFENLPIGKYVLEETKPAPGYENNAKKWYLTVGGEGLDPYVNDTSSGGKDLSNSIELISSDMAVLRPQTDDTSTENNIIKPHQGENLQFTNKFKVKSNVKINPGDYFVLKLSDNIDLEGIKRGDSANFDLFADGVGTVAKAKYDKEAGTITYKFTEYANQYGLEEFSNTLEAYVNLDRVKKSGNQNVGMGIENDTSKYKNVDVNYIIDTIESSDGSNNINLASKIVSFNTKTGEFEHYFYINRNREDDTKELTFSYSPNIDVSNLKFTSYILRNNGDDYLKDSMPESFGVDERNSNLYYAGSQGFGNVSANEKITNSIGTFPINKSMIIKVTGKVDTNEFEYFKGTSELYHKYYTNDSNDNSQTNKYPYVSRFDEIYSFDHSVEASKELDIRAINPKNKIRFKKIDQEGNVLEGAKFALVKYDETNKNWSDVAGTEKTSGKDGFITYEKLPSGKYALIEKEAPTGYNKIEGHIEEFTVGENGVITREVERTNREETSGVNIAKAFSETAEDLRNIITRGNGNSKKVSEPVTNPIDVINYKDIEFIKIDADDSTNKLEGAEFELYYKENADDKKYQPYKVTNDIGKEETMKVTSDKNGKFKLNISKDGYYALKETKAPDGYSKFPGMIKEFKLENGNIKILEKDPLKESYTKSNKGKLTSEILEVDKDKKTFKQRIIINPNHDSWTFDYDTQFRIYTNNNWSIDPTDNDSKSTVKVAVVDKNKKISDLTDKDFTDKTSFNYNRVDNIRRFRLKDLINNRNQTITTEDAIVVDISGKLADKAADPIELKSDIRFDLQIIDELTYAFDINAIGEAKGAYVDFEGKEPIQVENKKGEYPHTGGRGTLIFTITGLVIMSAAAYVYKRKRSVPCDE